MASWRIRFHDKWPHLASLYASTHNLDEDGKHPDPMMGQGNIFDPSEPYGAYRYYVQPSTRSEFSIEEPGYMSRPVYKDEESRSSDYTSGDSFRRGATCRVLLCVFLVVSFIGVVVAAITLAVLLSQTPTPLPKKPAHTEVFESQASIFNRDFNDQLLDNSTDEFKRLEDEFCKAIEQIFTDSDSPVKNAFGGCEVLEFINGSVQVRYRIKLFSDNPNRFKIDEKIQQKLEEHFTKKVHQIGPWQKLKFNPNFARKFVRIEPVTTPVPTTVKTILTTTKSIPERTTSDFETIKTTVTTRKSTTEHVTSDITHTETSEVTSIHTSESTIKILPTSMPSGATTMQQDVTTKDKLTTTTTQMIKTTTKVTPDIITSEESTVQITTKKSEDKLNETSATDMVTDLPTQTQKSESEKTTYDITSSKVVTVTEPSNVIRKADNLTAGTTEIPFEETTTDIFDYFYDLNDTFETTESLASMTEGPTTLSDITDSPTTSPDFVVTKTPTTSPDGVTDSRTTTSEVVATDSRTTSSDVVTIDSQTTPPDVVVIDSQASPPEVVVTDNQTVSADIVVKDSQTTSQDVAVTGSQTVSPGVVVTESQPTSLEISTTKEDRKQQITTEPVTDAQVNETIPGFVVDTSSEVSTHTPTETTSSSETMTALHSTTATLVEETKDATQEIPTTQMNETTELITKLGPTKGVIASTTSLPKTITETITSTVGDSETLSKVLTAQTTATEGDTTVLTTSVITPLEPTSAAETETGVVTEISNVTMPPTKVIVQDQEQTTSFNIFTKTKQPLITSTSGHPLTLESITTESGSIHQQVDTQKLEVNETTDKPLVTDSVLFNVTSVSNLLTSSDAKPKPIDVTETAFDKKSTKIQTSTEPVSKATETIIEHLESTPGISTDALSKTDMKSSPEPLTEIVTTELMPVAKTNVTKAASTQVTRMETKKSEELATTSVLSPEITTTSTDQLPDFENVTASSDVVTTDTYDYNASDIYYDYNETTTSGELFVEISTEPVPRTTEDIVMTIQTKQEETKQSPESTAGVSTEAITVGKLEITSESIQTQKSPDTTTAITEQTTERLQTNTTVAFDVDATTQVKNRSTLLLEITTQSQNLSTTSIATPTEIPTTKNVTEQSVDVTASIDNIETTEQGILINDTLPETPVTTHGKLVTAATTAAVIETSTQGISTEGVHREFLTTEKTSVQSIASEVVPLDTNSTEVLFTERVETELTATEKVTKPLILSTEYPTTDVASDSPVDTELASTENPAATGVTETQTTSDTTEQSPTRSFNDTVLPLVDISHTTEIAQENITLETTTVLNVTRATDTKASTVVPTKSELSPIETSTSTTSHTQQFKNASDEINTTEQLVSTTFPSVQETTGVGISNDTITTESVVNATEIARAENATSIDMQTTAVAKNVTAVSNQTTPSTPKPAEAAFLDEYGEAAFIDAYIPTAVNKTEETSVISTSNSTKVKKTTTSGPITTSMLALDTSNATETVTEMPTSENPVSVSNVTLMPGNFTDFYYETEFATTQETTNLSLEVTTKLYLNATTETKITTDLPVSTGSNVSVTDNVTVLPTTKVASLAELDTPDNFTIDTLLNNTVTESGSANLEDRNTTQPSITQTSIKDAPTDIIQTTAPTETNITVAKEKLKNVTVPFTDATESLQNNETSVQNGTKTSNATTPSSVVSESKTDSTTSSSIVS